MLHGEERNRTVKRTFDSFSGKTPAGHDVNAVFCDSELSVAEKWCNHCNEWVSTESLGLIGFVICPQCKGEWNDS